MVIEIKGAAFVNKGAQLMLKALITKRELFSDDSIFVVTGSGVGINTSNVTAEFTVSGDALFTDSSSTQ